MHQMNLLGFGDNIVDRFIDRNREYPGGNAVNVAVFARKIGACAEYLGVFGTDETAEFIRESIEAEGVNTRRCITVDGPSGVALIKTIDGERAFVGGNDGGVTEQHPPVLEGELLRYASGFDIVHSSIYSRVEPSLPALSKTGAIISFDFSDETIGLSQDYISAVAPHIDLALFSGGNASLARVDEIIDESLTHGASIVVVTLAARGAVIASNTSRVSLPAIPVEPKSSLKDTMGAGDALVTSLLYSLWISGWRKNTTPDRDTITRALSEGLRAANRQCQIEGAFARSRTVPANSSYPVSE
jgi:fructoselysine 6-kinase